MGKKDKRAIFRITSHLDLLVANHHLIKIIEGENKNGDGNNCERSCLELLGEFLDSFPTISSNSLCTFFNGRAKLKGALLQLLC